MVMLQASLPLSWGMPRCKPLMTFFLFVCCSLASAAQQPTVVALAGGSGAGKSFIVEMIKDVFGRLNVTELSHDWYYKGREHMPRGDDMQFNFDHPDALESSLMLAYIKSLQRGETIEAPVYDFATHSRSQSQTIRVAPAPLVLVDGILTLADKQLAQAFDVRIFVDTPADIRLLRRIKRDIAERNRSVDGILKQYETTVRPMHELFVEPSKVHADLVVSGLADISFQSLANVLATASGLTPLGSRAKHASAAAAPREETLEL